MSMPTVSHSVSMRSCASWNLYHIIVCQRSPWPCSNSTLVKCLRIDEGIAACRWVHWDPCWWLWTMKTIWALHAIFKQCPVLSVHLYTRKTAAQQVRCCNSCLYIHMHIWSISDHAIYVKATILYNVTCQLSMLLACNPLKVRIKLAQINSKLVWHQVHAWVCIQMYMIKTMVSPLIGTFGLASNAPQRHAPKVPCSSTQMHAKSGLFCLHWCSFREFRTRSNVDPSWNEIATHSGKKPSTTSNAKTRTKPTAGTVASLCPTIWFSVSARLWDLCSLRSMFLQISSWMHVLAMHKNLLITSLASQWYNDWPILYAKTLLGLEAPPSSISPQACHSAFTLRMPESRVSSLACKHHAHAHSQYFCVIQLLSNWTCSWLLNYEERSVTAALMSCPACDHISHADDAKADAKTAGQELWHGTTRPNP